MSSGTYPAGRERAGRDERLTRNLLLAWTSRSNKNWDPLRGVPAGGSDMGWRGVNDLAHRKKRIPPKEPFPMKCRGLVAFALGVGKDRRERHHEVKRKEPYDYFGV